MTLFVGSVVIGQDKNKIPIDREAYRQNVSDLSRLRVDSITAELLKEDTARLKRVIEFKDRAFVMLKEQSDFNRSIVDTLTKIKGQQADIITNQDEVIKMKDKTIETLNKRKVSVSRQVMQVLAGVGAGVLVGMFK